MYIADWQWDGDNLDQLAEHGLLAETVYQIADARPKFRRNKRKAAASHQMIGPDAGGRMWVVCIVAVRGRPGLWRAITGWGAEPEDENWYRGGRRR